MKILLAIDGSPTSDAAIAEVARRPWPTGTEVHVITVDSPIGDPRYTGTSLSSYHDLVREQRAEAQEHLNKALIQLNAAAQGLKVSGELIEGEPKTAIVQEAVNRQADLIIVGSHGYGSLQRLFLGSVSLAVATNSPCSVEIVRIPLGSDTPAR
jgi:nucleotide-binding universal stress UspA family protein